MNEHQTLVLSHYFADSSALLPFILSLLGPDQSREVQPLVSTVLLLGCSWVIFISVVFRKPPCLRLRGAAGPSPQTVSLPPGVTSGTATAEVEMGTRLCVSGKGREAA